MPIGKLALDRLPENCHARLVLGQSLFNGLDRIRDQVMRDDTPERWAWIKIGRDGPHLAERVRAL